MVLMILSDFNHIILLGINGIVITTAGSVYVRWGNTECPKHGVELVYTGFIRGSFNTDHGGAVNALCLPLNPQSANYTNGNIREAVIGAVEYGDKTNRAFSLIGDAINGKDAPCAVCRPTHRENHLMIPAKTTCFEGWTTEYTGYLMAGHKSNKKSSEYVCVDKNMLSVAGTINPVPSRALLYFVEASCDGAMRCPPYFEGREIACVVCTI